MSRFVDQDVDPFPDKDDTYRVSRDEDELRGTLVIGPDGEDLIHMPAEVDVSRSRRGRGRFRYDRTCCDCGDLIIAARANQIRCNHCTVIDDGYDL